MKILHTGDWHVGRTLSRVSRLEETQAVLSEIAEIAHEEDVDVIIVAGDVFEQLSPSAEAEGVVYEALLRFGQQGRQVVLLAGNHDHPRRWRALAPLFERFGIHVVDDLRPPDQGGIIELSSRDGGQCLEVAAVPWVSERRLYAAEDLMAGGERSFQSYADRMGKNIHRLCEGFTSGKCHVLAAHIFISGAVPSGTERPLVIGDLYAVTPEAIPATVQYAALGHVHRPQRAPQVQVPARYAGSIVRIDFGEAEQEKSVVIAELEPDLPAKVREVPLRSPRVLKDVRGRLDQLEQYRQNSADCYMRVTLECDGPQPGLSDQVREILPGALIVTLEYPNQQLPDALDVRSKAPRELFESYLSGRYESQPDRRLLDLFDTLLDRVSPGARRDGQLQLDVGLNQNAGPPEAVQTTPADSVDHSTDRDGTRGEEGTVSAVGPLTGAGPRTAG